MSNHAPWPPPGGRHRAAGLSGPARRYTFIVLFMAATSSLPILAAIGPGAGSVGNALAGSDSGGDTTPFIPPPSVGPIVVIPIEPGVTDQNPPFVRATPPPVPAAPKRKTTRKPVKPSRSTEAAAPTRKKSHHRHPAVKPTRPKIHKPRVRQPEPPKVIKRLPLWHATPKILIPQRPVIHRPDWHRQNVRRAR